MPEAALALVDPSAPGSRRLDRSALARAVTDLLLAVGVDVGEEGLRDTPRRVADAHAELLTPQPFQPTTFPNHGGYDELVIARAIPFHSLCMHHLLPFHGVAVLEAEHMCVSLRGVRKPGTRTMTSALRGTVRDDARTRHEFLTLTTRTRHD